MKYDAKSHSQAVEIVYEHLTSAGSPQLPAKVGRVMEYQNEQAQKHVNDQCDKDDLQVPYAS